MIENGWTEEKKKENAHYWKTARWMSEGSEIRERLTRSVTRDDDMRKHGGSKHGGVSTHQGYNCSLDILWMCSVSTTNNYFHADGASGLCRSILQSDHILLASEKPRC